jgi:hypothetical protein
MRESLMSAYAIDSSERSPCEVDDRVEREARLRRARARGRLLGSGSDEVRPPQGVPQPCVAVLVERVKVASCGSHQRPQMYVQRISTLTDRTTKQERLCDGLAGLVCK